MSACRPLINPGILKDHLMVPKETAVSVLEMHEPINHKFQETKKFLRSKTRRINEISVTP